MLSAILFRRLNQLVPICTQPTYRTGPVSSLSPACVTLILFANLPIFSFTSGAFTQSKQNNIHKLIGNFPPFSFTCSLVYGQHSEFLVLTLLIHLKQFTFHYILLLKTQSFGRLRVFWQRSVFSVERFCCYDKKYPQHILLETDFADNLFHFKNVFFIHFVRLALLVDVVVQKECCDSWSVWFSPAPPPL